VAASIRRLAAVVVAGVLLAGCASAAPSPSAAPPTPEIAAASTDADDCPVTQPTTAPPEIGERLFGSGSAHGNADLWVGGLGPGGVYTVPEDYPKADGSIGIKLGWWRIVAGSLEISGRRLDASAPALDGVASDGYGNIGFQASGVTFPTEGCWEVTGSIGDSTMTFVMLVVVRDS
jgi:hypothetical protein